jgi:alanine-glyoxylate transaminase/serine-glyoxylate transaminase/serine-pyruvate transaminase
MKAYESGNVAYFATPPVNLIYAFHESLSQITKASPSLEERFKIHREASHRIKSAASEVGLRQLPTGSAHAANGMTAVRLVGFLGYFNQDK